MRRLVHTVAERDVWKNYFINADYCRGNKLKQVYVTSICGRFLPCDVGKRIYDADGVLQIENDAQLKARVRATK